MNGSQPQLISPFITPKAIQRFERKFEKRGEHECWPWVAGTSSTSRRWSYGAFWLAGRGSIKASRVAFYLSTGIDPECKMVCHKCDNPICVNPSHLFLGTAADNNKDKGLKGRCNTPTGDRHGSKTRPERVAKGSRNGFAKLNEQQVGEIRLLLNAGIKQRVIGERFGVSKYTISLIKTKKMWTHVPLGVNTK